jgi:hypothetical protein
LLDDRLAVFCVDFYRQALRVNIYAAGDPVNHQKTGVAKAVPAERIRSPRKA